MKVDPTYVYEGLEVYKKVNKYVKFIRKITKIRIGGLINGN